MLALIAAVGVGSMYHRGDAPSAAMGLFAVLLPAVIVGGNLFYERPDEWQRRRAVLAFTAGGVAGTLWLMGEAVVGGEHEPVSALRVIGVTWLVSDVVIRMWPSMRARS